MLFLILKGTKSDRVTMGTSEAVKDSMFNGTMIIAGLIFYYPFKHLFRYLDTSLQCHCSLGFIWTLLLQCRIPTTLCGRRRL